MAEGSSPNQNPGFATEYWFSRLDCINYLGRKSESLLLFLLTWNIVIVENTYFVAHRHAAKIIHIMLSNSFCVHSVVHAGVCDALRVLAAKAAFRD